MKEAIDLANVAEQTGRAVKKLRSLFKEMMKDKGNQVDALEEELKQEPIEPKDKDVTDKIMQLNIAQLIPAHLRPEFAATVACSVRANLQQGCSQMTYTQIHNVTRDIQDLLRKPQRVTGTHPTPMAAEQGNHPMKMRRRSKTG